MDAIQDFDPEKRTEWVLKWPGQAVLAGSSLFWTRSVIKAIQNPPSGLNDLYTVLFLFFSI